MRYEKADNLLQLALEMQAARQGLSLEDIQRRFDVGRRTAMRMRDAILRNFPQAIEVPSDERVKRWRIPHGLLDRLIGFTADELSDLQAAVTLMRKNGQTDRAERLQDVFGKIRALMPPDVALRTEPDLEALIEAEGLAMRPGPRPRVKRCVLSELREGVKAWRKVRIAYRNRRNGRLNDRLVHPYGFLYGHRHYLVAFHEHPRANNVVLFSLSNVEKATLLEESFTRDPDFSLQAFAERSFGVFQEEPFDVVWKFAPEAAKTAAEFQFHPNQAFEPQKDGSLIVRFYAGSDLEMAWHLYMWGDKVEVMEPMKLQEMLPKVPAKWPGLP